LSFFFVEFDRTMIYILVSLFHLSSAAVTLNCSPQDDFDLPVFMTSGDFTIGGIFPLHYRVELPPTDYIKRPLAAQCRGFDPRAFRWALSMKLAVEEINNRKDLLSNHTLSYRIFDSCSTPVTAQKAILAVLNGGDVVQSSMCSGAGPLLGLIGESGSSQSIVLSRTVQPFQIPMVSVFYFSTCSCLSNRKQFPTFFRVVPNDDYQVKAIAQLLKRFGWTWIGVVTEDHDYGRFALQGLKREIENTNICLAYHEMIPKDYTQERVLKILKVMKESTAKVVVVFSVEGEFYPFLREFVTQNITGIQWIASEAWVTASMLAETYPFLDGTIGFAIRQGHIPGLQNYLKTVTPEMYPSNPQELWEALYGCSPSTSSLKSHLPSCTGKETLRQEHSAYMNTSSPRVTYNVYKAVYAFAHSLHNLIHCKPGNGPFENLSCANLNNVFPWQLQNYLEDVSFSIAGENVKFDNNGDSVPYYDLINWQRHTNGDIQFVKVGLYDVPSVVPVSMCSNSCAPGFRTAARRGQPLCCFDCVPCESGKISNQTDCMPCPEDYWSNANGTACVPKVVEFLSHDAMGITLTVIAVVGAFLTITVLMIFFYNRGTPIVRVNNSEISFFILMSLTLCFLCALVITFSLCISCILGKTLVVLAAFTATRPGNNIMKWLGPTQQRIIIFCCTLVQVIICTAWLVASPPFPYRNTKYKQSKIILDCSVGSDLAFWCVLGYIGLLACVCFFLAFLARKLPGNFNEAKYITFSMLIFCAVWLAFVPAYVSQPGKFTTAVEIFAILASSFGLLLCLFAPKCYIILLKPEKNTKQHLMGKVIK
uniref:G-protein coupled receptors family 3 profile domain-containing protein n=1 Tax=Cyprinus carpio TaxID=7962 RepID=A0A8C1QI67_CYPCA